MTVVKKRSVTWHWGSVNEWSMLQSSAERNFQFADEQNNFDNAKCYLVPASQMWAFAAFLCFITL